MKLGIRQLISESQQLAANLDDLSRHSPNSPVWRRLRAAGRESNMKEGFYMILGDDVCIDYSKRFDDLYPLCLKAKDLAVENPGTPTYAFSLYKKKDLYFCTYMRYMVNNATQGTFPIAWVFVDHQDIRREMERDAARRRPRFDESFYDYRKWGT